MNDQLKTDIKDWQKNTDEILTRLFSTVIKDAPQTNDLVGAINEARTLLLRAEQSL